MTDREKLIQLIEGALEHASKQCEKLDSCCACPHGERGGCQSALILDYLISNGVTFSTDTNDGCKWISVEVEKPEEGGTYIVVARDGHAKRVTFAKWQNRIGVWLLTGARSYWRVTHWMPMPEPPRVQGVPNGTDYA